MWSPLLGMKEAMRNVPHFHVEQLGYIWPSAIVGLTAALNSIAKIIAETSVEGWQDCLDAHKTCCIDHDWCLYPIKTPRSCYVLVR